MMITGINHMSFTVADVERCVRFWTYVLGFKGAPASQRVGGQLGRVTGVPGAEFMVAHLYGYGHHMEFIQYTKGSAGVPKLEPSMAGVAHVCFEVDEIDRTWNELVAAGATPQGEVTEISGASGGGYRAGYIRDPNGILIELLQRLTP
jgi:catechol 2,3-dioxygenase-like lactoylglutathione lyase family enzyme